MHTVVRTAVLLAPCQVFGSRGDGYGTESPHTFHETFKGISVEAAAQVCIANSVSTSIYYRHANYCNPILATIHPLDLLWCALESVKSAERKRVGRKNLMLPFIHLPSVLLGARKSKTFVL